MNKEQKKSTRRLFRAMIRSKRNGKYPVLMRFNVFLFRMFMPFRAYFMMQQVVYDYDINLAFKRSIEWSEEQIVKWFKERQ